MPNNENLRPPWPKGVSGNPKGRPKQKSFEQLVREKMNKKIKDIEETRIERLAEMFVNDLVTSRGDKDFDVWMKRAWPEVRHQALSGIEGSEVRFSWVKPEDLEKSSTGGVQQGSTRHVAMPRDPQ